MESRSEMGAKPQVESAHCASSPVAGRTCPHCVSIGLLQSRVHRDPFIQVISERSGKTPYTRRTPPPRCGAVCLLLRLQRTEKTRETSLQHHYLQYRCNRWLTFVKDSPDTFLLRQEPAVQTRDLLQIRTCANEQEPKHKNAVERVHCEQRARR